MEERARGIYSRLRQCRASAGQLVLFLRLIRWRCSTDRPCIAIITEAGFATGGFCLFLCCCDARQCRRINIRHTAFDSFYGRAVNAAGQTVDGTGFVDDDELIAVASRQSVALFGEAGDELLAGF